jgi:hypothetical protein
LTICQSIFAVRPHWAKPAPSLPAAKQADSTPRWIFPTAITSAGTDAVTRADSRARKFPLAARIFIVVDVWDALTSDHPYRAAWTEQDTLKYIREQSGKYFDPNVVKTFLDNFHALMEPEIAV